MEEKELISKLQSLKKVKPDQEWVILTKNKILLPDSIVNKIPEEVPQKSFWANAFPFISIGNRKLAYSFAVLFFALISLGIMPLMIDNSNVNKNLPEVDLIAIKNDVQTLKNASETINDISNENIDPIAVKKFTNTAKNITDSVKKNPKIAKNVAIELKTLASLSSADDDEVKKASQDLYKEVDGQIIEELKKADLIEDQKLIFTEAVALYEKEDYFEALEKILLIINGSASESDVPDSSLDLPKGDAVIESESVISLEGDSDANANKEPDNAEAIVEPVN